jgi:glycosyltransferase involved in cell wall biosynthesis
MNVLFIHQNFPAQFKHLAPHLALDINNNILALSARSDLPKEWMGVKLFNYKIKKNSTTGIHPLITELETKVIRGEACFHACIELNDQGFIPDVVIGHPGWGELLYIKEVWPKVKVGMYLEYYYNKSGADVGFDPEFDDASSELGPRLYSKNFNNIINFEIADLAICPTSWQASTFPKKFMDKISVIHDGIDTSVLLPNKIASLKLPCGTVLSDKDDVVTFVNRNLEPYRGYHVFMRSLKKIFKLNPNAKILIIGGEKVSYGAPPKIGESWKKIFFDEVKHEFSDNERRNVFFLGTLPYSYYLSVMRLSKVHVYLTYPFVLSWSLLESMSLGCAIVASDVEPVKEVINHRKNGLLVDFFNTDELAENISILLKDRTYAATLGNEARNFIVKNYDLKTISLPNQVNWIKNLLKL